MRKTSFAPGENYHIYNRGNSKQVIFHDKQDYERFIKLLYVANSQFKFNFRDDIVDSHIDAFNFERGDELVHIAAWCLMPNHFHILLQEADFPESRSRGIPLDRDSGKSVETERSGVSKFMKKVSIAYSMYYNKKYNRTGSLFEGRFKSIHVHDNTYMKYLYSYVHLNPLKLYNSNWRTIDLNTTEVNNFLYNYTYSSYLDYAMLDERLFSKIINKSKFPNYFDTPNDFKREINDWLHYENPEMIIK